MQVRFLTEPGDVAKHWPDVAPLLAPVVNEAAHGEFTLADIKELALARLMTLGLFFDERGPVVAMAFEFRHYPRFTVLNVVALGGSDLDAVTDEFFDQFKAWAAVAGAKYLEASCSPAMARLLARHGFTETYRCVRLAV